jgi:hypothetical protein
MGDEEFLKFKQKLLHDIFCIVVMKLDELDIDDNKKTDGLKEIMENLCVNSVFHYSANKDIKNLINCVFEFLQDLSTKFQNILNAFEEKTIDQYTINKKEAH